MRIDRFDGEHGFLSNFFVGESQTGSCQRLFTKRWMAPMNCNPDGTRLTTDDMVRLALEHGLMTEEQIEKLRAAKDRLFPSAMIDATRDLRHGLWRERLLKFGPTQNN